jgi:uncharacterized protein YkwD
VLDEHNAKRALHGVSPLTWSEDLASYAQAYIHHLTTVAGYDACSGNLLHSGGDYGENLAYGNIRAVQGVDLWYNENVYYNYADPANSVGVFSQFGHFTQVVWKSTAQLGCVVKSCPYNRIYLICEYSPAGNIYNGNAGADGYSYFKANVLPPVSG